MFPRDCTFRARRVNLLFPLYEMLLYGPVYETGSSGNLIQKFRFHWLSKIYLISARGRSKQMDSVLFVCLFFVVVVMWYSSYLVSKGSFI